MTARPLRARVLFSTPMRLLPLLALLLAACSTLPGKLCGAPDQPCCAASTCNDGALCGTEGLCAACGTTGAPCCPGDSCATPAVCRDAVCITPLSCECTLGETSCLGNGIQRCTPAPGAACPTWQVLVSSCPSGSVCVTAEGAASCAETCPGACTPDARLCTAEGLRRCEVGSGCPSLVIERDDPVHPVCTSGAVIDNAFSWESPTPLGAALVDIVGDGESYFWVLDGFGNIIKYESGPWIYEVRPTPGKQMTSLASCGLGSRLYAAGESGVVLRRHGGEWLEENVGTSTLVRDIACDADRAYALGANGVLYVRQSSTWQAVDTGEGGDLSTLAPVTNRGQVFLAGPSGLVVRCDVPTGGAPGSWTCVREDSPTTEKLHAIWAAPTTGEVWAVGDRGTMVHRASQGWRVIPQPAVTDAFVCVTGFHDAAGNRTRLVAATRSGMAVVHEAGTEQREVLQLPGAAVSAAWMPIEHVLLFAASNGALWSWSGPAVEPPFAARGGRYPTVQHLLAAASLGEGRVLAVGAEGTRLLRQNGAWLPDALGASTAQMLTGITARSPGEVYAVGTGGTVLVRRWGTWFAEAVGVTEQNLMSVAHDNRHVWAVGGNVLLEKDLATETWRLVALPAGTWATSVAVRRDAQGDATEVVVAGSDCALWTFIPGTNTFKAAAECGVQSPTFTAATFLTTGELVMASLEGHLYVRSGSTLFPEHVNDANGQPLRGFLVDGADVWTMSEDGGLYRRRGGIWIRQLKDVTTAGFFGGAKDETGLYFVGEFGTIIRRT